MAAVAAVVESVEAAVDAGDAGDVLGSARPVYRFRPVMN